MHPGTDTMEVAVRPIRIVGDPVLHTPTRPVAVYDDALRELVADLFDTMAAADGVGLAANQVGVSLRLFVFDCPDEELRQRRRGVVCNPVLETSPRPETMPPIWFGGGAPNALIPRWYRTGCMCVSWR